MDCYYFCFNVGITCPLLSYIKWYHPDLFGKPLYDWIIQKFKSKNINELKKFRITFKNWGILGLTDTSEETWVRMESKMNAPFKKNIGITAAFLCFILENTRNRSRSEHAKINWWKQTDRYWLWPISHINWVLAFNV